MQSVFTNKISQGRSKATVEFPFCCRFSHYAPPRTYIQHAIFAIHLEVVQKSSTKVIRSLFFGWIARLNSTKHLLWYPDSFPSVLCTKQHLSKWPTLGRLWQRGAQWTHKNEEMFNSFFLVVSTNLRLLVAVTHNFVLWNSKGNRNWCFSMRY